MTRSDNLPQAHIPVPTAVAANPATLNPLSLSIDETARMLSAVGGKRITPEQVQADIDAGAPVGPGGHINLVHYAAWLVREVQTR